MHRRQIWFAPGRDPDFKQYCQSSYIAPCALTNIIITSAALLMARLRSRDGKEMQSIYPHQRPLRIVASGTLFLTNTLSLPFQPTPASATRAHAVEKTRGGSASTVLSLLAQFSSVDAVLVASLGGNEDGRMILRDLEREGVNTRFCKIWDNYGVPSAWVLHAGESTRVSTRPMLSALHQLTRTRAP